MLGADKDAAEKGMEDALKLELKLAEFALPREKRRNKTALYNPMPLKYVQDMYPEIPLVKYINDITLYEPANVDEDEIVNVAVPDFVTKSGTATLTISSSSTFAGSYNVMSLMYFTSGISGYISWTYFRGIGL